MHLSGSSASSYLCSRHISQSISAPWSVLSATRMMPPTRVRWSFFQRSYELTVYFHFAISSQIYIKKCLNFHRSAFLVQKHQLLKNFSKCLIIQKGFCPIIGSIITLLHLFVTKKYLERIYEKLQICIIRVFLVLIFAQYWIFITYFAKICNISLSFFWFWFFLQKFKEKQSVFDDCSLDCPCYNACGKKTAHISFEKYPTDDGGGNSSETTGKATTICCRLQDRDRSRYERNNKGKIPPLAWKRRPSKKIHDRHNNRHRKDQTADRYKTARRNWILQKNRWRFRYAHDLRWYNCR